MGIGFLLLNGLDHPLFLSLGKADFVSGFTTACFRPALALWSRAVSCVPANMPLWEKCSRLGQYFSCSEWYTSTSPVWQNSVSFSISFSSFLFNTTSSTISSFELQQVSALGDSTHGSDCSQSTCACWWHGGEPTSTFPEAHPHCHHMLLSTTRGDLIPTVSFKLRFRH